MLLGNPITDATISSSGSYYDRRFPPSKVLADDEYQDGAIWLTPDNQNSWFVMDLGDSYSVSE